MISKTRFTTILILVSFFLNTAICDASFSFPVADNDVQAKLSVPLLCDDLVGLEHKDVGRIKLALEANLIDVIATGLPVLDKDVFQIVLEGTKNSESAVFHPADIQFFFNEMEFLENGYFMVMCRVRDRHSNEPRTYYAISSLNRDENGGHPIYVYTKKEYEKFEHHLLDTQDLPQRRRNDAKAIERYVQHEKGVDEAIAYAHENDLVHKPAKDGVYGYGLSVKTILGRCKVNVADREGSIPIEEREFFFVKKTRKISSMISDLPAKVVDINGNEKEVICSGHSSNIAVHIFLDEDSFKVLSDPSYPILSSEYKVALFEANSRLAHEIGVMLGQPVKGFMRGNPYSEMDERWAKVLKGSKISDTLEATVVDLDRNLTERDYAVGHTSEVAEYAAAPVITVVGSIVADIIVPLGEESPYPIPEDPGIVAEGDKAFKTPFVEITDGYLKALPPELREQLKVTYGGPALASAMVLHQLGARVKLIGAVGDDGLGKGLIELMEKKGMDTSGIKIVEGVSTSTNLIFSNQDTNETSYNLSIGGANDSLEASDIKDEDLEGCSVLHLGGIGLNPNLMMEGRIGDLIERAHEKGVIVGWDTVVDVHSMEKIHMEAMRDIDYATPSIKEAGAITDLESVEKNLEFFTERIPAVFLKNGENGSEVATREDSVFGKKTRVHMPAVADADLIDGTGAGDSYSAYIAYAVARGISPVEAAKGAAVCGALTVERIGGASIGDRPLIDFHKRMQSFRAQISEAAAIELHGKEEDRTALGELLSRVTVSETEDEMGRTAAQAILRDIERAIDERGKAVMLFASAPSQHSTWKWLIKLWEELPEARRKKLAEGIIAFHMDEYLGLEENAEQLFGNVLSKELFKKLNIRPENTYYFNDRLAYDTAVALRRAIDEGNDEKIKTLTGKLEAEARAHADRIVDEFEKHGGDFDVVVGGIGKLPHVAFNDPPGARFKDPETVKVVRLSEESRVQQVLDGEFNTISEVPTHALTFTLPPIFSARHIHIIVPREMKAESVRRTLDLDITEDNPASGLRLPEVLPQVRFYFDRAAASESTIARLAMNRKAEKADHKEEQIFAQRRNEWVIARIDRKLEEIDDMYIAASEREEEIRERLKEILLEIRGILKANPDVLETPLKVGAIRETKQGERRTGLVPDIVNALAALGINVTVERGTGTSGENEGSRFGDEQYEKAGASIAASAEKVFETAQIVQHIKELQKSPDEEGLVARVVKKLGEKIIFNFNHFAQSADRTVDAANTGAAFVSFENVFARGRKPILEGPSQKAGVTAAYKMALYLLSWKGGDEFENKETLEEDINQALAAFDVTNNPPIPLLDLTGRNVVVYGGGVVGYNEARMLALMGANVTVIERNRSRIQWLEEKFAEADLHRVSVIDSRWGDLVKDALKEAHGISTTAYTLGKKARHLIDMDMLRSIGDGKVFTVVDIDQGGGVEGVKATSHAAPVYLDNGNLFYCVPNIPAVIPRQTSIDISLGAAKYLAVMALYGLEKAATIYPELSYSVDVAGNRIANPAIQQEFTDMEKSVKMETDPAMMTPREITLSIERAKIDAERTAVGSAEAPYIPTHPHDRYTLLVTSEFYKNGELKAHRKEFGDRFNLDTISGKTHEQFVENTLAKAKGIVKRAIALVPTSLPQDQLERLKEAGIRFIRTDTEVLLSARVDESEDVRKFQVNTYAMMLLSRRMDEDVREDFYIYKALSFYIRSHFALADDVTAGDYIRAIVNGDISTLIKGYLSYRPAEQYNAREEYDRVAAILIAA